MGAKTDPQSEMLPNEAVEWLLAMPSVLGSVLLEPAGEVRQLQPLVER